MNDRRTDFYVLLLATFYFNSLDELQSWMEIQLSLVWLFCRAG